MPGHRVGDVVLFGGRDDDPCSRAVQEADPQDAIATGPARRQHGLIAVDFHLSAGQRRQVAVVEHLDFNLHLCENKKRGERAVRGFSREMKLPTDSSNDRKLISENGNKLIYFWNLIVSVFISL